MSQVEIKIHNMNGRVVIEFDQLVEHIEFDPQEAVNFAAAIGEKAKLAFGNNGTNIAMPYN